MNEKASEVKSRSSIDHSQRLSLPTSSFYKNQLQSMSSPNLSEFGQLQHRKPANTATSRLSLSSTFSTLLRSFKKKKFIEETQREAEETVAASINFDTPKPVTAAVRNWDDLSLPEMKSTNRKSSLEKLVLLPLDDHSRQRASSIPLTDKISIKSISPISPLSVSVLNGPPVIPPSVLTMGRGKKADTRVDGAPVRKSSLANDDLSAEDLHKLSTLQRSNPSKGVPRTIDRVVVPERNESLPRKASSKTTSASFPPKRNSSLQPLGEGVSFTFGDIATEHLIPKIIEPTNPNVPRSPAIHINQRPKPSIFLDINPTELENVTKTIPSPSSATSQEKYKTLSLSPARGSPPKFMTLVPDIRGARSKAGEQDLVDMKKWVFEKELEAIDAIAPELSLRRKSIKRSTTYKDSHVALTPTTETFGLVENSLSVVAEGENTIAETNESNDSVTTRASSIPETDILKDVDLLNEEVTELAPTQPPAAVIVDKLEVFIPSVDDDYNSKSLIGAIKLPSPNLLPLQKESSKSQLTAGLRQETSKKKPWKWFTNLFGPQKKSDGWNPYPQDYVLPNRLSEAQETEIYSLSHVKLSQTERTLLQQVQISNFMMYILSVHSNVTIKGRGPQRRKRKKKRRVIRNPLISPASFESKAIEALNPTPAVKKDNDEEDLTSSSSSGEDDDLEPGTEIKAKEVVQIGPATVPLIAKIPQKSVKDEEDEIPLGILARTPKK